VTENEPPEIFGVIEVLLAAGEDPAFSAQGDGPLSLRTIKEEEYLRLVPLALELERRIARLTPLEGGWIAALLRGAFGLTQVRAAMRGETTFSEIVLEEDLRRAARELEP